jgi:hypothetical protein
MLFFVMSFFFHESFEFLLTTTPTPPPNWGRGKERRVRKKWIVN